MIWKYGVAWIPMVVIGIANGVLRQSGYGRFMGELRAHQVSTFTGIVLFLLYIWVVSLRWPFSSARQAVGVGLLWVGMTVVFEFGFGHYVAHHPWSRLVHDYNLLAGRLWVFVLAAVAVAPYVFFRIRS